MPWLDHLNAILVGAGVLAVLGAVAFTRAGDGVDETRLHMMQTTRQGFTEQVQIDIENLGVRRQPGEAIVTVFTPTRFAFRGVADTTGTPAVIEYRRILVSGTDGTPSARYRIERVVGGAVDGSSTDLVTGVNVTLRDPQGVSLLDTDKYPSGPDYERLKSVDVRVEWALPFEDDSGSGLPERVGWSTLVQPVALRHTY